MRHDREGTQTAECIDRRLGDRRQKTRGREVGNLLVVRWLERRDLKRQDAKGAEGEEVISYWLKVIWKRESRDLKRQDAKGAEGRRI
jgi:hypothetical protein